MKNFTPPTRWYREAEGTGPEALRLQGNHAVLQGDAARARVLYLQAAKAK